MAWAILENEGEETNPETEHHVRKIRDELVTYAKRLDSVELYWLRNRGGYKPTGKGIAIDDSKEPGDPIEGARMLVKWAWELHESDGCRHFQVHGFGETTKGTSKAIFQKAITLGESDDDPGSKKAEKAESIQAMEVLRGIISDFHQQKREDHEDLRSMVVHTIDMAKNAADATTKNGEVLIQAMKLKYKQEKKKQHHEYDMHRSDRIFGMFDKFADRAGPGFEKWFDYFLSQLNMNIGDLGSGPLAERLNKIWKGLSEDQLAKCKTQLGDDAWDLLEAARKAKDDQEFCNIVSEIGPKLASDPSEAMKRFMPLAATIGQENFLALVKLLKDAGVN